MSVPGGVRRESGVCGSAGAEPEVSVIVPVFNAAGFLRETLASILAQNFSNLELLVIDDASTDNSGEVIRSFDDPRLRSIRNATNRGVCVSRNRGMAMSRGLFLAFCDHDDLYPPHHLGILVGLLHGHPEADMVYTAIRCENRRLGVCQTWFTPWSRKDQEMGYVTVPTAVMLRASLAARVGGFSEDPMLLAGSGEDWEYWLRVSDVGTIVGVNTVTCLRVEHGSNRICRAHVAEIRRHVLGNRWESLRIFRVAQDRHSGRIAVKGGSMEGLPERKEERGAQ